MLGMPLRVVVGDEDGVPVGALLGVALGLMVGAGVGAKLGEALGTALGDIVGKGVPVKTAKDRKALSEQVFVGLGEEAATELMEEYIVDVHNSTSMSVNV